MLRAVRRIGSCPVAPTGTVPCHPVGRPGRENLVLADNDPVVSERPRPKSTVVEEVKAAREHVFGIMSTVAEPTGQGRRQLVIDQKPHATSTTTWFVCWAA